MAFDISRDQQKLFIEHFMKQVLDVALDLVDQGKAHGSPGEMVHKVGRAVIAQLYGLGDRQGAKAGEGGDFDA